MSDLTKLLESGIEINGVYQRVIPVLCYIDIPIQIVINKLESIDNKTNKFFEFLNFCSPVIVDWIDSNSNKTFEISDYIKFLQTHLETTRDFMRFALREVPGIYVKKSSINEEFIGLDEDYIKGYNYLVSEFDLVMKQIPINVDLRTIPSNQVRPKLIWSDHDENIKTIFVQTSFQIGAKAKN